MLTTDYVRSLGAERHWERKPNMQKLIKMMLTVFSAIGNGDLDVVGLQELDYPPYLDVNKKALPRSSKLM